MSNFREPGRVYHGAEFRVRPDVTFMWLTDPDGTAHRHGIGAPQTLDPLRQRLDEPRWNGVAVARHTSNR